MRLVVPADDPASRSDGEDAVAGAIDMKAVARLNR
jgi:hypothetical protein